VVIAVKLAAMRLRLISIVCRFAGWHRGLRGDGEWRRDEGLIAKLTALL